MRGGFEPFDVESETKIHFFGRDASFFISVYGGQGFGNAGMMFCDVISSVHQVVGHYVEEI